jgi:MinD superfamily P-loop ATPase
MRISIASGKGGTGKSFIALNLACTLAKSRDVCLVDCDVEEPNLHLFFEECWTEEDATVPVPVVDSSTCTLCGRCGEICQFGAITVLSNRVLLLPDLCHSCGGCSLACPEGAIHEEDRVIGKIQVGMPFPRLTLVTGILKEGEIAAPRMIRMTKERVEGHSLVIYDGPPGTACPVIETLEGSDLCILVTEPTPFGYHDLRKAASIAGKLGIPAGVVINRSSGEDSRIRSFCASVGIPVWLQIPFDRQIALLHGRGKILVDEDPNWQEPFQALFQQVCRMEEGG